MTVTMNCAVFLVIIHYSSGKYDVSEELIVSILVIEKLASYFLA
jgi:hypothetical protein